MPFTVDSPTRNDYVLIIKIENGYCPIGSIPSYPLLKPPLGHKHSNFPNASDRTFRYPTLGQSVSDPQTDGSPAHHPATQ